MRERAARGRVEVFAAHCRGCGLCIPVCPLGALSFDDGYGDGGSRIVRWQGNACLADELCYYACPEPGALRVNRIEEAIDARA